MRVPLTLLAALLASGGPALAQPAKHNSPKPVQPSEKRAEVLLASADTAHSSTPAAQSATAAKRPVPQITHCRCGDPQPGEDTPEQ